MVFVTFLYDVMEGFYSHDEFVHDLSSLLGSINGVVVLVCNILIQGGSRL